MWKILLIEIIGNVSILLMILGVLVAGFMFIRLVNMTGEYETNFENLGLQKVKVFDGTFKILSVISMLCLFVGCGTPSKKSMYITLGVSETVNWIRGNEQVKNISKKTLKLIDKKLDKYLDSTDNHEDE